MANKILNLFKATTIPNYDVGTSDSLHYVILYSFVRALEPELCVEIGSRNGGSALWIATGLKDNGKGKLLCVDAWVRVGKGARPKFINTIKEGKVSDIICLIEGMSCDVVNKVPKGIDLLFIDAAHDEESCYQDIKNYVPKLNTGGVVLFHDYWPGTGVKKAINKYDFSDFKSIPLPTFYYGVWAEVKIK